MREQYPLAPYAAPRKMDQPPTEANKIRREWFKRRNEAIQQGVKQPASGTFGKPPKD